jgi:probable HAF family extracellular repeat protein
MGVIVGAYDAGNVIGAFLWDGAFHDLGNLGGLNHTSRARAVNDFGVVVGLSEAPSIHQHAFIWRSGDGISDLGTLPGGGDFSSAEGINNSGVVVGSALASSGADVAVVWQASGGAPAALPTLGGASQATDINDEGLIVGWSETAPGERHAVLWENGHIIDLGLGVANAVNKSGMIVGEADDNGLQRAALWR